MNLPISQDDRGTGSLDRKVVPKNVELVSAAHGAASCSSTCAFAASSAVLVPTFPQRSLKSIAALSEIQKQG
jgi:hypothetical protein